MLRQICSGDRLVEQKAKRCTAYGARVHRKTDDTARELIHNNQNPVRSQDDGFAAKEVDAPKTVLHVADEGQPRRAPAPGSGR